MNESHSYRTKSGRVLGEDDLERLAAEAAHGYDVERMMRRPGRPRIGSAPAVVVPVRLHNALHSAVKSRAAALHTSVSDLVRQALGEHLESEPSAAVEARTRSGQILGDLEIGELAAEAETGYDVHDLQVRAERREGRAQVVPVRLPPDLKTAVERRADIESTSVSDVIRTALRAFLGDPDPDPPAAAPKPRRRRRPTESDTCRDYVLPRLE